VAVGAVICQPDRDPCPLAEKRTLRPPFALSVGFGPAPSPPSGASPVAPSHDNQPQSIPTTSSYSSSPLPPELVEHPRPLPLLKAAMRRGGRADPGRVQRVPPHPRTHNEQDRVQRGTVADARPMTAQRMHRPRRQQPLHTLPQPVRHPPTIIAPDTTHHSATLVDFSNEVGLRPHQPGPYLAG
jgi:hypothetical protein